ncbi:MAG: dTDP-4-dehydrorhamnose reductase [Bacteroidota bacterium]
MRQVLVTGANGQLGRCMEKIAHNYSDIDFTFKDKVALDITSNESITSAFMSTKFDFCINCAAYTNVEEAEKNPKKAFEVNAEGVKKIALSCKENNVVLIHISTDYVFDGEKEGPYVVEDVPNPINEYGKSKLAGEKYVKEILENYYILRTSWLYSEFGHNFYKTILKKAETQDIVYVTDQQMGSPTNAKHLAEHIIDTMIVPKNNRSYGIHHFTDGEAMTWYSFALKILAENRLNGTVKVVSDRNYRSFAARPRYSVLKN